MELGPLPAFGLLRVGKVVGCVCCVLAIGKTFLKKATKSEKSFLMQENKAIPLGLHLLSAVLAASAVLRGRRRWRLENRWSRLLVGDFNGLQQDGCTDHQRLRLQPWRLACRGELEREVPPALLGRQLALRRRAWLGHGEQTRGLGRLHDDGRRRGRVSTVGMGRMGHDLRGVERRRSMYEHHRGGRGEGKRRRAGRGACGDSEQGG